MHTSSTADIVLYVISLACCCFFLTKLILARWRDVARGSTEANVRIPLCVVGIITTLFVMYQTSPWFLPPATQAFLLFLVFLAGYLYAKTTFDYGESPTPAQQDTD